MFLVYLACQEVEGSHHLFVCQNWGICLCICGGWWLVVGGDVSYFTNLSVCNQVWPGEMHTVGRQTFREATVLTTNHLGKSLGSTVTFTVWSHALLTCVDRVHPQVVVMPAFMKYRRYAAGGRARAPVNESHEDQCVRTPDNDEAVHNTSCRL